MLGYNVGKPEQLNSGNVIADGVPSGDGVHKNVITRPVIYREGRDPDILSVRGDNLFIARS